MKRLSQGRVPHVLRDDRTQIHAPGVRDVLTMTRLDASTAGGGPEGRWRADDTRDRPGGRDLGHANRDAENVGDVGLSGDNIHDADRASVRGSTRAATGPAVTRTASAEPHVDAVRCGRLRRVLPEIGESAKTLGVRRGDDIKPDARGLVRPGQDGMSVNDSPRGMPEYRRPPEFGRNREGPEHVLHPDLRPAVGVALRAGPEDSWAWLHGACSGDAFRGVSAAPGENPGLVVPGNGVSAQRREDMLEAIESENGVLLLRDLVQRLLDEGVPSESLVEDLSHIHGLLPEELEDHVLDVMDLLVGWCATSARLVRRTPPTE